MRWLHVSSWDWLPFRVPLPAASPGCHFCCLACTHLPFLPHRMRQVAALQDKVAGQQGLAAEQAQRIRDMEVGGVAKWESC